MGLATVKPWFRARLEEALLITLATPLFLAQPVGRVIDTLVSEAQRLGFNRPLIKRLLMAGAVISMNEPITKYVGSLGSVLETMVNTERLGIEPSTAVLHILRELDDYLGRLRNDHRDLVMLLDMLTVITLAIMPMTIVLVSRAIGIDPTMYLVTTYVSAAPITALLGWSLDPGLVVIDNELIMYMGAALIPAVPAYVVTRSIELAWLAFSTAFLGLSLNWYVGKVRIINEVRHTAINRVMRAAVTLRLGDARSRNWLEGFINEYTRAVAITGMGRPDVINVAVTSLTHVINTIMESRRIGYASVIVSISLMEVMLVITRLIATQVAGGAAMLQLMLPTVILGGFMSGYVLDSVVTGIYTTVPLVITYIALTMT
ncbi:hypothetical protein [Vulcanisaeta souniana]|uniref:Uncharacterized protein n=1 Tax=Vulcanisaeta souniana JCM 11219 TaxID=1293586 RepID=A0A830EIR9_9CREN|nr:hypothetical protein [Vulcanisaeta souniana]BDR92418.1 hypothetical protein Vsou_15110 [Vulcanisaeta souniana JCM 11219]GGI75427.1 hypothetical protein GCM10007112_10270 [Vulcanisaeta souniana JCM 11219]